MAKAFHQRLKQACDQSPLVPDYGRGRQAFISERLKVSQEAVRKWFKGESRPRPSKMRALSMLLEVEESWLALGVEPELDRAEKKVQSTRSEGAVYLVYGMVTIAGGHCAFPTHNDPRHEFVDFYAIYQGVQCFVHVTTAREVSASVFEFLLPAEYQQVRVIGVVPTSSTTFDLLELGNGRVERHKQKKSGRWAVTVSKTQEGYVTGADVWRQIRHFGDE